MAPRCGELAVSKAKDCYCQRPRQQGEVLLSPSGFFRPPLSIYCSFVSFLGSWLALRSYLGSSLFRAIFRPCILLGFAKLRATQRPRPKSPQNRERSVGPGGRGVSFRPSDADQGSKGLPKAAPGRAKHRLLEEIVRFARVWESIADHRACISLLSFVATCQQPLHAFLCVNMRAGCGVFLSLSLSFSLSSSGVQGWSKCCCSFSLLYF